MTVKELMEKLSKLPPDKKVYLWDQRDAWEDCGWEPVAEVGIRHASIYGYQLKNCESSSKFAQKIVVITIK